MTNIKDQIDEIEREKKENENYKVQSQEEIEKLKKELQNMKEEIERERENRKNDDYKSKSEQEINKLRKELEILQGKRDENESYKSNSEQKINTLRKEIQDIRSEFGNKNKSIENLEKKIDSLTQKKIPEKKPEILKPIETPYQRLDKAFNSKDWNKIKTIITNEIDLNDQNYKTDLVKKLIKYSDSFGYDHKYERANVLEFTRTIVPNDLDLGKKLIEIYEKLDYSESKLETLSKELLNQKPDDYNLKSVLSEALVKKARERGKYNLKDAIPVYEELVELNENNGQYQNLLKSAYMDAGRFDDVFKFISGNNLLERLETLISDVKSKLPLSNEYSDLRYNFKKYLNEKYNELDNFEEKETILKKNLELNRNKNDQGPILIQLSDLYRERSRELYEEAARYSKGDPTRDKLERKAFNYKHKAHEVWD